MSVGRRPNTDDLGLDGTSVEIDERGFVKVDEGCRTGEESVWADGDAIATPQLAHIAFIVVVNAIQDILVEDPATVESGKIQPCTYPRPETASIGRATCRADGCQ